jgi:hypothetical protein
MKRHKACPGWDTRIHHPESPDPRKRFTKILEYGDKGSGASHGICEECRIELEKQLKKS